jgi:hypothetical protein
MVLVRFNELGQPEEEPIPEVFPILPPEDFVPREPILRPEDTLSIDGWIKFTNRKIARLAGRAFDQVPVFDPVTRRKFPNPGAFQRELLRAQLVVLGNLKKRGVKEISKGELDEIRDNFRRG